MSKIYRFVSASILLVLGSIIVGCTSSAINYLPLESADNSVDIDVEWRRSIGEGSNQQYLQLAPLVVGDTVYAADHGGRLVAVKLSTGRSLWEKTLPQAISGGVAGDSQQLFVSTVDGQLHAISTADGELQWSKELTSESIAPVGLDNQRVFSHTVDGRVTALERSDGKQAWSYKGAIPVLTVRGVSQPVVVDQFVVVGLATGKIIGIDKVLGIPRWEARLAVPDGRSELERLVDIDGSAVLNDGKLYASSYHGNLVALDPSGRVLWQEAGSAYTRPSVGLGSVYLTLDDDSIQSYDALNGAKSWRQAALQGRGISAVTTYKNFLITSDKTGYLHVISQVDGRLLGRTLVRPTPLYRSYPHQGEATHWRAMRGLDLSVDSPIVATDEGVLVLTNSGELMLVDIRLKD